MELGRISQGHSKHSQAAIRRTSLYPIHLPEYCYQISDFRAYCLSILQMGLSRLVNNIVVYRLLACHAVQNVQEVYGELHPSWVANPAKTATTPRHSNNSRVIDVDGA